MQTELDLPTALAEIVAPDVMLLHRRADSRCLLPLIAQILEGAPLRHLITPGGGRMSVAMSNCGPWGWHSDTSGYRYVERDPLSGRAWPVMPPQFTQLANAAAAQAGFAQFEPDCCLINQYVVGAQMGAHRDFDECDLRQPIVSVSLGAPATFLWHGAARRNSPIALRLVDGDVLVWGGVARAGYHAVRKLKPVSSTPADALRFNLTFRRAR